MDEGWGAVVAFGRGFLEVLGAAFLLLLLAALVGSAVDGIKRAWENSRWRVKRLEEEVEILRLRIERCHAVLCTGWRFQEEGYVVVAYKNGEEPESFTSWEEATRYVLGREVG